MGFTSQERLKKAEAVMQNKSSYVYGRIAPTHIYVLFKIDRICSQKRALNADGTAKPWLHKYLFNAEWESRPRIPIKVQNILLEVVVQF